MTEEELHEDIQAIAGAFKGLYRRAELAYTPLIDTVIQNESKDSHEIEQILDGLLGFACDDRMLVLFKKLCRYYYSIDPEAAVEYVDAYREMWVEENE